jgi:hypothetical protein
MCLRPFLPCGLSLCWKSHAGLLPLLGVAATRAASIRAAGSTKDAVDAIVVAEDLYVVMAGAAEAAHPLRI